MILEIHCSNLRVGDLILTRYVQALILEIGSEFKEVRKVSVFRAFSTGEKKYDIYEYGLNNNSTFTVIRCI